jgi:hypothetical protein
MRGDAPTDNDAAEVKGEVEDGEEDRELDDVVTEDDTDMEGRKGRVKFRRAVTTVFEIANGPPSGPLRRYYGFGVPPTEAEKQELCAKLLQALLVFMFSKQIGSPNVGKWTLLGPSLDGVAKGHWSFDIYGATFRLAFDKLKFKQLSSSMAGLSVGLLEDTCWSEVAGKVAANALDFCPRNGAW